MKVLALSLLLLSPMFAGSPKAAPKKSAAAKFPLPLPKSYKMPENIQAIVLHLYKNADSVADFRDRYMLIYEDKADLKAELKMHLWAEGQDTLSLYMRDASYKAQYEQVSKMAKDLTAWGN